MSYRLISEIHYKGWDGEDGILRFARYVRSTKSNNRRKIMEKLHHIKCKVCSVEKTLNFFQLKKGSFSTTCSWCESKKLLKQLKLK